MDMEFGHILAGETVRARETRAPRPGPAPRPASRAAQTGAARGGAFARQRLQRRPGLGPETRTTASPARPGALARAKIVARRSFRPCPSGPPSPGRCPREISGTARTPWPARPARHPGLHHGFGIAGVEGRFHPRLHLFHHFLLQRRHIRQAHQGAGFLAGSYPPRHAPSCAFTLSQLAFAPGSACGGRPFGLRSAAQKQAKTDAAASPRPTGTE